jgi:hypothetical protein
MKAKKESPLTHKVTEADLKKLMATSGSTAEGASYACQQFENYVKRAGAAAESIYKKAVDVVEKFAKYVGLAASGGDGREWSGKKPATAFQSIQQVLANECAHEIDVKDPIKFAFAVSDKAEFLKLFTAGGKKVDAQTQAGLDQQLTNWLAKNKWKNIDGVIHELNDKGKVKTDANGKPELADPAAIKKKMEDNNGGFKQFAEKAIPSLSLSVQERDYATQMGGGA